MVPSTLAAAYVGTIIRYTRSVMIDVMSQDYVQTARTSDLARWRSSAGMRSVMV